MYQTLRGYEVPWGQAELVHRQTEGNPLFVQEVLRYLVEEGIVVREDGTYVVRGDATAIPEGLRDVVGRRLAHLTDQANQVLGVASVIGRDFDLATLFEVIARDEEDVLSAVEESLRIGILEERSLPGSVRYRFTHAFFRQTLYEEIIAPRRLRLHQEVARALETQYAARRHEHAAELAEHFSQSTDRADLTKAVEYGRLAAQRSSAVFAYSEAASHLKRCVEVQEVFDSTDQRTRCDLLLELGTALNDAGEPDRVLSEVAPAALEAARTLDDNKMASAACQRAIDSIFALGAGAGPSWNTPEAQRWCELADEFAAENTRERFWADCARVWFSLGRRDFDQVLERLDSVRTLANKLNDHDLKWLADAYSLVPMTGYLNTDGRLQIAREMAQRSADGVRQLTLRQAYYFMAVFGFMPSGDREGFDEMVRRCEALAEKTHQPNVVLLALAMRGISLLVDGKLEECRSTAADLLARGEELGLGPYATTLVNTFEPRAWFLMGGDEPIQVRALSGSLGRGPLGILRLVGDVEAAKLEIGNLLKSNLLGDAYVGPLPALVADISMRVGDVDSVRLARARMPDVSDERFLGGPIWHISSARQFGDITALLAEPSKARDYYEQALEDCDTFRMRAELALSHLGLAEVLLDHYPDEHGAAIEHLDFAIAEFQEMKMQPALERALGRRGLLKA